MCDKSQQETFHGSLNFSSDYSNLRLFPTFHKSYVPSFDGFWPMLFVKRRFTVIFINNDVVHNLVVGQRYGMLYHTLNFIICSFGSILETVWNIYFFA